MPAEIEPFFSPPGRARKRSRHYASVLANVHVRGRGFWAAWPGLVLTLALAGITVALFVGWILAWLSAPTEMRPWMVTLGSIAYFTVVGGLVTLILRLRLAARLQQAEAAFLTATSHNLRTPVAGIRAAAQTLAHPGLDPAQREHLQVAIVHETERLQRTIDNVLETARLEVERTIEDDDGVDVTALTADVVDAFSFIATVRGGTISLDERMPAWADGDAGRLRLVVENLIDNALKYSGGPPDITVRVFTHGEPGWVDDGWVVVQVADRGLGFDPATAPQLFERFQRGDSGKSGIGLGLPLSKGIARAHGGDVMVSSPGVGSGATAELWLPATTPPASTDPTVDATPEQGELWLKSS